MTGEKFSDVLRRIDAANAADPEGAMADPEEGETPHPAALLYGRRMSGELVRFCPDASEHLRIAARGQHIERWKLLRSSYPDGREGYLTWRRDQGHFHASRVAGLMREAGYGRCGGAGTGGCRLPRLHALVFRRVCERTQPGTGPPHRCQDRAKDVARGPGFRSAS